jgi:hypothetical protein
MIRFFRLFLMSSLLLASTIHAQSSDPLIPYSGNWQVTLVQETNNCPDEFEHDLRWIFDNGAILNLDFTTAEDIPYKLHEQLVGEEIYNVEQFTVNTIGFLEYEIYPNIMTQPYTYRYLVSTNTVILLRYLQTIALSDCELLISYDIHHVGTDATSQQTHLTADLSQWNMSDYQDNLFTVGDDPDAICASDPNNPETWYFMADDAFVEAVRFGYGETLSYDLKLLENGTPFDAVDVILVIGNGGMELHYEFWYDVDGTFPNQAWQTYQVVLDEQAGWVEFEGMFDASDSETFRELLVNTSQVWIRGKYLTDNDQTCIQNVFVGEVDLEGFGGYGEDQIGLLNGNYDLVVEENTCNSIFPAGTIQQQNLSFNYSDDGELFYLWTEGGSQPTVYIADGLNFYQTEIENLGTLLITSSTDFEITNKITDQCIITYSARWTGN